MWRAICAAGAAAIVMSIAPAQAVTPEQKMETCNFGANDKKLTGTARKAFISKCMADAPQAKRGKPVTKPPAQ
jgi:psiF repeat